MHVAAQPGHNSLIQQASKPAPAVKPATTPKASSNPPKAEVSSSSGAGATSTKGTRLNAKA
jgi:hypothetical protein